MYTESSFNFDYMYAMHTHKSVKSRGKCWWLNCSDSEGFVTWTDYTNMVHCGYNGGRKIVPNSMWTPQLLTDNGEEYNQGNIVVCKLSSGCNLVCGLRALIGAMWMRCKCERYLTVN